MKDGLKPLLFEDIDTSRTSDYLLFYGDVSKEFQSQFKTEEKVEKQKYYYNFEQRKYKINFEQLQNCLVEKSWDSFVTLGHVRNDIKKSSYNFWPST